MGITLSVMKPQLHPVDVSLTVWPVDGVSGAQAVQAARTAVESCFADPMLRQGFFRSQAGSRIYQTGLVKNYEFHQPTEDSPPTPMGLYTLGTLQITEGT